MHKKTDGIICLFSMSILAIGFNAGIQSADVEITIIRNIPLVQEQFPLLSQYMAGSAIMENVNKELQEQKGIISARLSACESLERVLNAQSKTPDAVYTFFEDPTTLGTIAAFFSIDSWAECLKRKIGIIVMNQETLHAMEKGDVWGKAVTEHYSLVESEFKQFCTMGQAIRRAQEAEARKNTELQKQAARLIPAFESVVMSPEEVEARNRRYQK